MGFNSGFKGLNQEHGLYCLLAAKRHIKLRLLAANNECCSLDIDMRQTDGVIRQPRGTADNAASLKGHLRAPPALRG